MTYSINDVRQAAREVDGGDHLGAGLSRWKGVQYLPAPGDAREVLTRKAQLQVGLMSDLGREFVPSQNMIRSVITNVCDHVCGSEPTWTLTAPTEALREEAEAILTAAWNARGVHTELQTGIRPLVREGRGAWRIRIPTGAVAKLRAGERPSSTEIASRWLRIEAALHPERMRVVEDDDTLSLVGEFTLDAQEGRTELTRVRGGRTEVIERSGETNRRLWALDLGGRLPYVTAQAPALITQSMLDNQGYADVATTAAAVNVASSGRLRMHFHNITPMLDGAGKAMPQVLGPGGELYTTDTIAVQSIEDGQSVRDVPVRMNGEVRTIGGESPEPLNVAVGMARMNIYAEAQQLHYLMGADATASGEARKTAMAAFLRSLNPYRSAAVKAVREINELILALVAALSGTPGKFAGVVIEPVLTDRLVDPTPQERAQDAADVASGLISMEEARSRQGILNSQAMQRQIEAERVPAVDPAQ
ncbi:hypothetical protein [Deinococcus sedimenti]|uniref:Phage portal protein n=1 Tax=Deinococcus sedimenti TaxID=1867090 RepID=A0ABQ2S091_9DEIO|nr:hypothetical protein [Deinococcus sedimenti]GGR84447.1 hypothetical protein GCM10008960_09360 [Deinococcus sedimenti]